MTPTTSEVETELVDDGDGGNGADRGSGGKGGRGKGGARPEGSGGDEEEGVGGSCDVLAGEGGDEGVDWAAGVAVGGEPEGVDMASKYRDRGRLLLLVLLALFEV